ncbi:MAG: hypothetical protein K2G89_10670 [Lachnospiraceae bacterium]|nr:hypothetical protein [Lachnospiraceae bacterium]
MGKIILCETNITEEPFIFTNTRVEVYSYEEFCFYVYNNLILVTMDMMDNVLFDWFKNRLKMEELADNLYELREKNATLDDYLVRILMYKNFYSVDEVREFVSQFEALKLLRSDEREKQIADGYLKYRRYSKAATIYKQLLEREGSIADQIFLGNVYHNMAVALANDLQLEAARYAFLKAFTLNENEVSLRSYFLVMAATESESVIRLEMRKYHLPDSYLHTVMDEVDAARDDMQSMQLYHRVQKAVYNKEHGDSMGYSRRMDSVLQEIKENFREQTI